MHRLSKLSAWHLYYVEKKLLDILRGATDVSPELKEMERQKELCRYERKGKFVKKLLQEKALAKSLTLQQARDILWALTGRDIYCLLVIERKWSSDSSQK